VLEPIKAKIQSSEVAAKTVKQWQAEQKKVVFTNGCFDLLHYGHIHYLAAARNLGDALVIGVNSAASIRRLKGPSRPIHDDNSRYHLLAAMSFVDLVVEFDNDTPLELITMLLPDVLVKGGDWTVENIVGADLVIANGGMVKSLPFIKGYSTTAIEQKIQNKL